MHQGAIFPAPAAAEPEAPPAAGTPRAADPAAAARLALQDILILLPVLSWFILDATQVAIVVLIVIVTLLRQHDRGQGQQAALGLILGNLIGGIAAAVFYNLVLVGGSLLFFIAAYFAASLIFAGRIVVAAERAPFYAIAFATFILLVGLGMSPLPGTSGEAFFTRLLNVLLASAYAIGGLSLVESGRRLPS
ncbi:FUSC family protein [Rhizobium gallicum]|nr:FUSC family protein [Rhizobium gallicum]